MLQRSKKKNGLYFWVNEEADEIRYVSLKTAPKLRWKTHSFWKSQKGIKCLDSFPGSSEILGAGSSTGNLSLLSEKHPEFSAVVTPKYPRACKSLSFSHSGNLAAAYAKSKNDLSLKIWDVRSLLHNPNQQPALQGFPMEGIVSVCYDKNPFLLFAGSNTRSINIVDTRKQLEAESSIETPCFNNIILDPVSGNYFAANSYDGHIAVYDRRFLVPGANPLIMELNPNPGEIKKNSYFQTRFSYEKCGQLSCLSNNSISVRQLSPCRVQDDPPTDEPELENSLLLTFEKFINMKDNTTCSGFDYYKSSSSSSLQLLAVVNSSPKLFSIQNEFFPASFSANNKLISSYKDTLYPLDTPYSDVQSAEIGQDHKDDIVFSETSSYSSTNIENSLEKISIISEESSQSDDLLPPYRVLRTDISSIMLERAQQGYRFNCSKNYDIVSDFYLKDVWKWVELSHSLYSDERYNCSSDIDLTYQGALGIWFMDTELTNIADVFDAKHSRLFEKKFLKAAETIISNFDQDILTPIPTKRPLRQLVLLACGLGYTKVNLDQNIDSLIGRNEHVKAAGLALFHGKIENVVRILAMGNELEKTISTAVAGYITSQGLNQLGSDSLWKEMSRNLSTELEDPYLRAIFAYVSNSDWRDVLDEVSLSLRDRLGIALRFLPDEDLSNYLEDLCRTTVQSGDPEGLILTGLTPLGIELLQNFVNYSNDVQTAALLVSYVVPKKFTGWRADGWIVSYRELFNRWRLYRERVKFDLGRTELSRDRNGHVLKTAPKPSLYISCNYCKKSLLNLTEENPKSDQTVASTLTKTRKLASQKQSGHTCPHCRQPFPKCSVCGLSLSDQNVPQNNIAGITSQNSKDMERKRDFGRWFSFCLRCYHGTHAAHASEWFMRHSVCPVPDCDCNCALF
ncbi:GATOR2-SEACAT complex ubiquitin-protein ligase E3 subunit Sea4 [Schizosaccharomyces osmophilus]|uniref:GATOR2-SEACAT complex ubiquitin-protein ligase E3 subunit Sea4 n=1 Tax=Schizosaccharomyces osmophilus TaxID=2545709 RepID=A0AAE9WCW1_9SCHI|nr:GATOR2-SEACAT complex ubiquitin-protein ligase E3 subunit Sea4 [Schizosaccharomyces osmophilus]WBW73555.1 GATOR2-SEACAT complex ubiquitin-protein ligase E3 subunit Sea4 [Schizosaccharomyces osmophilus]